METVEAIASAPPARAATARYPGGAAIARKAERFGHLSCEGQTWTFRNGFDRVIQRTPLSAWLNPQQQAWQRIKENARREVWRARIEGSVYYLKYYRHHRWVERLKTAFRRPACRAEWLGGLYALETGIAAVTPAGYTTHLRRDGREYCLLVTEAVEPAYPLDEFWRQIEADPDTRRRRRDAAHVADLLGEMIARAHQAGFEHLDMHAANILVQPVGAGRYRTLFVDLQSARRGVPLSDRAVVRNLAQLNQWFRRHSTLSERLRFLRAYVRWRNEYEAAYPYGQPLRLPFRQLTQALSHAAQRHARRLWAQRDRRARRHGRYFAKLKLPGGWRGLAVTQTKHQTEVSRASRAALDRSWWITQLTAPLRWYAEGQGQLCKDSHSASVRRTVLPHPSGNLPVIIKRPLARNWRRRLSQLITPSRSLRAWRIGHALLHRSLSAARPLAVLERRLGPLTLDSILITEAVPGAADLETHLRMESSARGPKGWYHHKREVGELLARQLRRLEERGFSHRDCKASNILFVAYPAPTLLWIDMDGLRPVPGQVSQRQRLRALTRLHVSLLEIPGLTRTDRARFLRAYCARWGARVEEWRNIWRQVEPLVALKRRTQEARRQWKNAHYGRE